MARKRFGSIRFKAAAIMAGTVISMLLIILSILNTVLMGNINTLEKRDVANDLQSVSKTLDAEYERLSSIANDWGTWDDSYRYVQVPNAEFVEQNLYDEILINLDANFMVFLNRSGDVVYAGGMDLDKRIASPVSGGTLQALRDIPAVRSLEQDSQLRGLMSTPDGLAMMATVPILTSTREGPVQGHFVIGRYLDRKKVGILSETLNRNLSVSPLARKTAADAPKTESPIEVTTTSETTIQASMELKDIAGLPVARVTVEKERSVRAIGLSGVRSVVAALVGISVLASLIIMFLLDKAIISRLLRMERAIVAIGEDGALGKRLEPETEQDELATVTNGINTMLESLEESQLQLVESERKYRTLVEEGCDVVFCLDRGGVITYISHNCAKVVGYTAEELSGTPLHDLIADGDRDGFLKAMDVLSEEQDSIGLEYRFRTNYGTLRWFMVSLSLLPSENAGEAFCIGLFHDVNERKEAELALQDAHDNLELLVQKRTDELVRVNEVLKEEQEKIKHLAYHDYLTGLPNSLLFKEFLSRSIAGANRSGKPLAVFFIDLDGFKMINDTLGHVAGDQLLIAVAQRLTHTLRKNDVVARISGDEFNILIDEIDRGESVDRVATKILRCFDKPLLVNGQECFISASAGISIYPIDGEDAVTLVKNADLALYRAKDNGRNQYCFCTGEMKEKVLENMMLSNQLWRALERRELEVYYQPQVSCTTNRIVGSEALLRWNHPELGLVSPAKFIPLAEQTGSINSIGEWVLSTACMQNKSWQERFCPDLRIAVNLSVKQLYNFNIVEIVRRVLGESGMTPETLELEITESLAMREINYMVSILNKLKALGVDLAIDDFGTEYSSMNYLKQLPVDRIKLAMPFVQGINVSEKDEAITKAVIILAKNMGMRIIAEGVETAEQLDFLTSKMCDETQGFYFYKPMPAHEMEAVLREQCRMEH